MSRRPLTCAETFRRLDDYLDRELSADDLVAVDEHLKDCEMCSGEFAVERVLLDGIRAKLARVQLSESVKSRIAALIQQA